MQIQSAASLSETENTTNLVSKCHECKNLVQWYQVQPNLAIKSVKDQIKNCGVWAEIDNLSDKKLSVQNVIQSRLNSPYAARMAKFRQNLQKLQHTELSENALLEAALIETIKPLAKLLYDCAHDYLGLKQSNEVDMVFVECARQWHNQPKYREFSMAEVRDVFNLAAMSKVQIYNNFSVMLFYSIMDEYLEKRRVIIGAIEKINSDIAAQQFSVDEKELERRENLRKEFIQNAANSIQQATKLNTSWRIRGKLRIQDFYCTKAILEELILRGVIKKTALNSWKDFFNKFASKNPEKSFYSFNEFLEDHKGIQNYKQILEGFKIGKTHGFGTDLTAIRFGDYTTHADIELAIYYRAAFIERAKTEFVRFLYWTVLADYTNPNYIVTQNKLVYTLTAAQASCTNWIEFCEISLPDVDIRQMVSIIKTDAIIAELGLTEQALNDILLSKLKSKPAPNYTVVSLASFLISSIANYAQQAAEQKTKFKQNENLQNLAQSE